MFFVPTILHNVIDFVNDISKAIDDGMNTVGILMDLLINTSKKVTQLVFIRLYSILTINYCSNVITA